MSLHLKTDVVGMLIVDRVDLIAFGWPVVTRDQRVPSLPTSL